MSLSNQDFHRFLRVPHEPKIDFMSKPVKEDLKFSHILLNDKELNPDLVGWFNNHGIAVPVQEAFYNSPNGGGIIVHTDLGQEQDLAKFIWSFGAPGSKMIWWKVERPEFIQKNFQSVGNSDFLYIEERYCRKVFEQEISGPSLVQTGGFHSTYNPTPYKRWTLSLLLWDLETGKRLSFSEAYLRLKSHIIE